MLKRLIQSKLHERQKKEYERELKLQRDSYAAFLRIYETGLSGKMIRCGEEETADGTSMKSDGTLIKSGKNPMKPYGHTVVLCQESMPAGFFADKLYENIPKEEYLLFAAGKECLSADHLPAAEAYFREHPKTQVVYFHTDEIDHDGRRSNPCFLPEWSPDTLVSFFYFGECFAVRAGAFQKAMQELEEMYLMPFTAEEKTGEQAGEKEADKDIWEILYTAVLLLTAQEPAVLMDVIMYHKSMNLVCEESRRGAGKEANERMRMMAGTGKFLQNAGVEVCADGSCGICGMESLPSAGAEEGLLLDRIWRRLFGCVNGSSVLRVPERSAAQARFGRWQEYAERSRVCSRQHQVSILIPSKDHPEILRRCVESIREYDKKQTGCDTGSEIKYEIIVIDNGSGEENRRLYEACAKELGYHYEYRPMEFNFSRMCNIAAGLACGDYYLFLNDDMEVVSAGWMEKLLEFAALSHVGAVGAKLLYPDTMLIQHAGITNMYEGPAHKLLKYDDRTEYYGGRNRGVWDVIGVTAACLMISKEKFDQAGGFAEELKVAYNDVDFCFRLHQRGLFNVVRNDLVLYHHESLSRGNDHLDPAKRERLAEERKTLYRRSPGYYDYDPFYSRHLTGASEAYECVLPYENRNIQPVGGLKRLPCKAAGEYPGTAVNETLIIQVDAADLEPFAGQGKTPAYLIDLHAHVRGLDSCDYRYRMVLKGKHGCYEVPAVRRLRPDVERTIGNEKHVELSGFVARIPKEMLPSDDYEIWMEAKCCYSRQRLYNKAAQTLEVRDRNGE